mmetsp:Transcript_85836/g.216454  ORF Transcript_85836/g.216454 Transcript_85836/m.216454 type:complete len:218 (-) Transcript_85836:2118-2771(-)
MRTWRDRELCERQTLAKANAATPRLWRVIMCQSCDSAPEELEGHARVMEFLHVLGLLLSLASQQLLHLPSRKSQLRQSCPLLRIALLAVRWSQVSSKLCVTGPVWVQGLNPKQPALCTSLLPSLLQALHSLCTRVALLRKPGLGRRKLGAPSLRRGDSCPASGSVQILQQEDHPTTPLHLIPCTHKAALLLLANALALLLGTGHVVARRLEMRTQLQ